MKNLDRVGQRTVALQDHVLQRRHRQHLETLLALPWTTVRRTRTLAQLAAAGDVEGERVLLDTIARLRSGPVEGEATSVVPMRARRAR